jgi:glycosyltransferase involved in cell wall biosynthesis
MLDRTLKAFQIFAKDKPEAVLFIHADADDAAQVFNMRILIEDLGLQNRVFFSGMRWFEGFDYGRMNEVYNLMDIFFLSTSGEGFGIPIIEAAAAGIPSAVTDYATTQELLIEDGKCGLPIAIETELTGTWNVERGIMGIPAAVNALNELYASKSLREQLGIVGREKMKLIYDWPVVLDQWDQLFQKVIQ